jgi:hypothetical protein
VIRGIASGRYRAFLDLGLNVADVRDVAREHVLELGYRPGPLEPALARAVASAGAAASG